MKYFRISLDIVTQLDDDLLISKDNKITNQKYVRRLIINAAKDKIKELETIDLNKVGEAKEV